MEDMRRCPYCGSTDIRPKGYVYPKSLGQVRLLRCKVCGHRPREKYCGKWKRSKLPENLLQLYLELSIDKLIEKQIVRASRLTIYAEIQHRLSKLPKWKDFLYDERLRRMWSGIMGIDTTKVKVGGKEYIYLHVVDIPSGIPLAYEILERETADHIEEILLEIRNGCYWPRLIITDLAAALLEAIERVFPGVPVQACLFHLLDWLNESLPTRRKGLSPEKRRWWSEIKVKILSAALVSTVEERLGIMNDLLNSLSAMGEDERRVVEEFRKRLEKGYYHTLGELAALGCEIRYAYNNVCERSIEFVKELQHRMRGFKKVENAQGYINALWYYRIKEKLEGENSSNSYWDSQRMARQILDLIPKGIKDIVDLKTISKVTKIPLDDIKRMADQAGLTTATEYAFSKRYVCRIVDKLFKAKPTTIMEAAAITGIDHPTLCELLPKIGLEVKFRTLDISKAEIIYPKNNLNGNNV
ncbi:MAG: transposase [Candidatus Bathyarchaeia archaeon]